MDRKFSASKFAIRSWSECHLRSFAVAILLLAGARTLCSQALNERVLVVYNSSDAESRAVAEHYLEQRKIPQANRCAIAPSSIDYLKQSEYESRIRAPLRKCIETVGKQKVLYIVFSYHTPYDVLINDRSFALDSFVADLWDEYSPTRPGNEIASHAYFGEAQSQGNFYAPFVPLAVYREQPRAANLYSVWRLDAATAELAKGLVDKALFAEAHGLAGKACFDLRFAVQETMLDTSETSGEWDIHQAAEFARRAGFEVVEDDQRAEFGTAPAPLRCDGAALYAGWYDLNHYNDAFTWNPGAIGLHLDSASAANPRGGTNWAANAVMKGITITSGAAAEPYLEGMAHPDQVFRYLLQGANAGDALLRSTRWLKWMILNIGDPLYRPFPKGVTLRSGREPETLLALLPQAVAAGAASSGLAAVGMPVPEAGVTVSLASSRPEVVSVPKTVTIPAKAQFARFPIITHSVGESAAGVLISMSANGVSRSNTMVVHPCMPPLTFSAATIKGGTQLAGTVTLYHPAGAEGLTVKLASGKPAVASVPGEVKVAAGATQATFPIVTRPPSSESAVAVTATTDGCTRSGSFTVVP
jgi:uncharacterized protein (TIGR03790 family)